ncbi:MAG: THUMP domain-containing protein [Candidatus Bathyarchaeota archaeon]|nr:THUMP domain-containing protein [Candidatus Bathyarchaeota archaeon]
MTEFFFLLSGEHETLPAAELKAILRSEKVKHIELERLPQILRINSTDDCINPIRDRAALTRACCRELFSCKPSLREIVEATQSLRLEHILRPEESFAVRVRRVGLAAPNLRCMDLERKLGELILDKSKGSKVNLSRPNKTFFGTITVDRFLFGLSLAVVLPASFFHRRPRKRPFFHPSTMPPKLARCMVNLAEPRKGDWLLDPFCGAGSFLIEGGLLGCRIVGFDAKKLMVEGTWRNLKYFNIKVEGLAVADARHLPLNKVDRIVTDPPYGRSASTMGQTAMQIIKDFLKLSSAILVTGQRMCMAAPRKIQMGDLARDLGFKVSESHLVYVHRSLTREIVVLEQT